MKKKYKTSPPFWKVRNFKKKIRLWKGDNSLIFAGKFLVDSLYGKYFLWAAHPVLKVYNINTYIHTYGHKKRIKEKAELFKKWGSPNDNYRLQ